MLDPKTLWRIKTDVSVVPVPPPVRKLDPKNLEAHAATQCYSVPPSIRKINSKGTAVLNARRAGDRGKSKRRLKTTSVLG